MADAVRVVGLCKQYGSFALKDISMTVEAGTIMGLVGENGAGKTTTIKSILGLVHPDAGGIEVMGEDALANGYRARKQVGYVPDECCFHTVMSALDVARVMRALYPGWEDALFKTLIGRFGIDPKKQIKDFSKGMRMKLSIAAAMAHRPKLLILDEPTGGLDPIARDELLDILQQFVEDEDHAVLFSTHITSDLDKIADAVTFLHEGKLVFSARRDELMDTMGVARLSAAQLAGLGPDEALRVRREKFGCEALLRDRRAAKRAHPDWVVEPVSIEEIMLMIVKGDAR